MKARCWVRSGARRRVAVSVKAVQKEGAQAWSAMLCAAAITPLWYHAILSMATNTSHVSATTPNNYHATNNYTTPSSRTRPIASLYHVIIINIFSVITLYEPTPSSSRLLVCSMACTIEDGIRSPTPGNFSDTVYRHHLRLHRSHYHHGLMRLVSTPTHTSHLPSRRYISVLCRDQPRANTPLRRYCRQNTQPLTPQPANNNYVIIGHIHIYYATPRRLLRQSGPMPRRLLAAVWSAWPRYICAGGLRRSIGEPASQRRYGRQLPLLAMATISTPTN